MVANAYDTALSGLRREDCESEVIQATEQVPDEPEFHRKILSQQINKKQQKAHNFALYMSPGETPVSRFCYSIS